MKKLLLVLLLLPCVTAALGQPQMKKYSTREGCSIELQDTPGTSIEYISWTGTCGSNSLIGLGKQTMKYVGHPPSAIWLDYGMSYSSETFILSKAPDGSMLIINGANEYKPVTQDQCIAEPNCAKVIRYAIAHGDFPPIAAFEPQQASKTSAESSIETAPGAEKNTENKSDVYLSFVYRSDNHVRRPEYTWVSYRKGEDPRQVYLNKAMSRNGNPDLRITVLKIGEPCPASWYAHVLVSPYMKNDVYEGIACGYSSEDAALQAAYLECDKKGVDCRSVYKQEVSWGYFTGEPLDDENTSLQFKGDLTKGGFCQIADGLKDWGGCDETERATLRRIGVR